MSGVKQNCALILSDSPETDEALISTFGLTGEKRIPVEVGFKWCREFRTEEAHDIYVVRLDTSDLDWIRLFGAGSDIKRLWSPLAEIYKRYFTCTDGRNPKMMHMEFDLIALGTPEYLAKLKHRGAESSEDDWVPRL